MINLGTKIQYCIVINAFANRSLFGELIGDPIEIFIFLILRQISWCWIFKLFRIIIILLCGPLLRIVFIRFALVNSLLRKQFSLQIQSNKVVRNNRVGLDKKRIGCT